MASQLLTRLVPDFHLEGAELPQPSVPTWVAQSLPLQHQFTAFLGLEPLVYMCYM